MKKILIISYFFPPCAKAGAHRAYSMAEYLPRFGWKPIFVVPEKGYYGRANRVDNALLDVVQKFPIYHIPFFYPFNNQNSSLLARGVRRLWETAMFPDGKVLWNKEIKSRLQQIINRHRPDILLITSTPFSSFLLAPYLKRKFDLPVVIDYRDPWAANPDVERSRLKAKLAFPYEKQSLSISDLITTASYHIIDYIKKTVGSVTEGKRFFAFPYGYNGEFFRNEILPIPINQSSNKITATFAGFVHGEISAETILGALKSAIDDNQEMSKKLRINCYGTLFGYSNNPQRLINKYNLDQHIILFPFLPYVKFLKVIRKSSFLLLPLGDSQIARVLYPTKFFDYLGVKRPILYIGGYGQVAETIKDVNAGICTPPESVSIKEALVTMVHETNVKNWYSNDLNYKKLDRIHIFSSFCKELNALS